MKPIQTEKTEAIHSAFAEAKGVSHHHLHWTKTLSQTGELKRFTIQKGQLQVGSNWGLLAWGSWIQVN